MAKTGRPTKYSDALINEFCTRIADGRSVKSICMDDDMPDKSTIFDWLGKYPEFSDKYAHAKEMQAESIFDESLHIADTATVDDVQLAKLRIDTRKWMAGKLRPQKYGDTTNLNVKGSFTVNLSGDAEAL